MVISSYESKLAKRYYYSGMLRGPPHSVSWVRITVICLVMANVTCWSEMPLILCFIMATGSTELAVCREKGKKEWESVASQIQHHIHTHNYKISSVLSSGIQDILKFIFLFATDSVVPSNWPLHTSSHDLQPPSVCRMAQDHMLHTPSPTVLKPLMKKSCGDSYKYNIWQ